MQPRLVGDLRTRQRFILVRGAVFVPLTLAAAGLLHRWLPPIGAPSDAARALLALRCIGIAAVPLAAVIGWVMFRRLVTGAHNPLLGAEDETLRIHLRVVQNTLEQWALFAAGAGACAATLPAAHLHGLVGATVLFVVGRVWFWWGYLRPANVLARSPGVQITGTVVFGLVGVGAAGAAASFWG
jgi:hypothetical protein